MYEQRLLTIILQECAWYDIAVLLRAINAIRRINFNIAEQRVQALQRLNNAACPAPFTLDERFRDGRHYVCEAHGDWGRKLQQLRLALSIKSRDKDQGLREGARPSDMSDAIVAFSNATTAIYDQLLQADGVVDRVTFEEVFGFEWA